MGDSETARPAAEPARGSAGYRVVARRYRPQRFSDLIGQLHVARGLAGAIGSGRIGHAYLFTGARGVGKTSAARIFAKALECTSRDSGSAEPCNACDMCQAISAGQDVDVVEIDAASNRGIDEIRQLRQNAAVRPARGAYKIYIIDEVHMLTREAFNALLKTLEEPPAHVKFVLCTTEPEKLPITILSRCQRFDFLTVDAAAIEARLAEIAAAEGMQVAPDALRLVAKRAAGSMRDSQSLLEQLLGASGGGRIGVDEVHAMLGTGRDEGIVALAEAIAGRDPRAAVAALDAAVGGGADAGGVLEQLLAVLREAMLASIAAEDRLWSRDGGCGVDVMALAHGLGTETILAMMQIIDQTLARMRLAGHAAVLAEMAVVRLASLERLEALAAAIERLTSSSPPAPSPAVPASLASREKKTADLNGHAPRQDRRQDAGQAVAHPVAPLAASRSVPSEPEPPAAAAGATTPCHAELAPLEAWLKVGELVGGMAAGFIGEATAATWHEHDAIEVTMPSTAEAGCSFLKRPEVAASITATLEQIAGRRRTLFRFIAAPVPQPAPRPMVSRSQAALLRKASEHPLVTHARSVLDAAIRRVDPPAVSVAGGTEHAGSGEHGSGPEQPSDGEQS